jgi:hypothetical protein
VQSFGLRTLKELLNATIIALDEEIKRVDAIEVPVLKPEEEKKVDPI